MSKKGTPRYPAPQACVPIASPSRTLTWSLDALGNFASVTTNGGSPVNNTFNKQNEETQAGSANLAFDHNGNTTTDEGKRD